MADGERQIVPGYGTLRGERSLAEYLFLNRGIFSLRVSAVDRKVRDGV